MHTKDSLYSHVREFEGQPTRRWETFLPLTGTFTGAGTTWRHSNTGLWE